jgi:hypothetical protein
MFPGILNCVQFKIETGADSYIVREIWFARNRMGIRKPIRTLICLCKRPLRMGPSTGTGRLQVRIHVRIGVWFGVRFGAKGGLQSNLGSIFSEMCLHVQTVVMGVWYRIKNPWPFDSKSCTESYGDLYTCRRPLRLRSSMNIYAEGTLGSNQTCPALEGELWSSTACLISEKRL